MMKRIFLCLTLILLFCCNVNAIEKTSFAEIITQKNNTLMNKLNEDEKNKLYEISTRLINVHDEYKRECKAIYNDNLVLFYFPDTKTMSITIYGKINYISNSYVPFTELGLKYNKLIMTLPITNMRYDIIPYSCAGYGGTCRFYNDAFASFNGEQLSKLQSLFNNCNVVSNKRWYGGYNYLLQCPNTLTKEWKLYPSMQYAYGLFIDDIGLHDLLYYGCLLQKIGYKWI